MRTRARPGRLRTVLAAALLVAACAPVASPSPTAGRGGWTPQTSWEHAVSDLDASGHYSLEAALRLFSIAYGPLPGVDGDLDRSGVIDRTVALEAVQEHWTELTDEQRAAVEDRLAPSAAAVPVIVPPAAVAGDMAPVAVSDHVLDAVRKGAQVARARIAALLGTDFLGDLTIVVEPRGADVPLIEGQYPSAATDARYDAAGVFSGCTITIYEEATIDPGVVLDNTLHHEVFHCFQRHGYQTDEARLAAPVWVKEGQAAWVGQALGGPSPKYDRFWEKYLVLPTLDLRARSYDAIGFYAHLEEVGQDPWSIFEAMWAAGSDHIAIYQAAGADAEAFVDSWASGVVRQGGRGRAWDTTGPGITTHAYVAPGTVVEDGTVVDLSAAFFTNDVRALSVQTDLLAVRAEGHVRLNDVSTDAAIHGEALYCVEGHDCSRACPGGGPPPQTSGTIGREVLIASSGSWDGTIGEARGSNLEDACETDQPSPSPRPTPPPDRDPCQSACGESNGDVHIGPFGDYGYDFQAVGEFVLARSADGQFEVQTRQAPLGTSTNVSINTAVAVRAGAQRLAIYLDPATSSLRLTVGGVETPLADPVPFGSGGIIAAYPDGVRIDAGDGSHVYVIGWDERGLNLLVEPGPEHLAGIAGLMGANPPDSRYPALRDGSSVGPLSLDRHANYVQLYETLADAWRVDQASSLFDYAQGESTETYTRRGFPAEADLVFLENLSPAQLAAGEAACAGVTDPDLHRMCVYDVGVTADPGYGDLYETTIALLETGSLGRSDERVRVVNLYANGGIGTAIDVYAWAGDAFEPTTPGTGPALVATVPYTGVSDWFNPGRMTNGPFDPVNWLSIQRGGEPIGEWRFNLLDLPGDSSPGREWVLVITGDPESFSAVGGTAATFSVVDEEAREGFPLIDPPAGTALGFLNPDGMFHVHRERQWVASVDGRCLTDPDFPALARPAQGRSPYPVVLEPGTYDVAIHEFPLGADAFDLDCDRFPSVAESSVSVQAGDRVHLFVYAERPDAPVRLLVLPVGD